MPDFRAGPRTSGSTVTVGTTCGASLPRQDCACAGRQGPGRSGLAGRLRPLEFWQTAPDAGQPSSERTEVGIVYTESAIYFGVVLLDRDPSGLTTSDSATRRSTTPTAFALSSTHIETGRTVRLRDDAVGARVRRPVEWRGHQRPTPACSSCTRTRIRWTRARSGRATLIAVLS